MLYSIRGSTTRCQLTNAFFIQRRLKHQPPNRTIDVQLLTDVKGLGELGSIQTVAPGRMRSVLYPRKQAVYLLKNEIPQLPPIPSQRKAVPLSSLEEVDFANIKSRLEALAPLIFRRPLKTSAGYNLIPSAKQQAINGPITAHDIAQRLRETYNLSLEPPDAVLSFQGKNVRGKIRTTGSFVVLIQIRTGDIISLTVLVEPETRSKEGSKLVEPVSQVA